MNTFAVPCKEHLAISGRLSREREDVYPVRELSHASGLERPVHLSGAVQWSDLTAVHTQLHNQRQTIESLTQSLRSVERERDAQQRAIQMLQEEVRRLRERLEDRDKERECKQDFEREKAPAVETRLEQWKRDVGRELSTLRGHIDRATSLGNREERETKRQYEHSCKTLETVTDSYRTHDFELSRIISQYKHTQQDVRDLRCFGGSGCCGDESPESVAVRFG
ncbi:BICD family-like cargo adapter 2 [Silurus meridionalis]|nr:BICD family-like cargo adapter 2 [Silurus meridionalis]